MNKWLFFLLFPLLLFGKSFLYQLQNLDINETANSRFDLVVTSYSKDGTLDTAYTIDDLKKLHDTNKTVLSYLSIGEAGKYEYYFDSSWIDSDGNPTSTAPKWLGHQNPNWPGDYKVRYWYDEWFEDYLKPYIDRIIDSGFDGLYLDIIDAYEYWADNESYKIENRLSDDPIDDEDRSASLMIGLVKKISDYAKSKKPNFLIYPQNGASIINYDTNGSYLKAIDGIGIESLFYMEKDKRVDNSQRVKLLRGFRDSKKDVIVTDYVDDGSGFRGKNRERILDFIKLCKDNNFTPYVAYTDRELDRINKISKNLAPHLDTINHPFFSKYNIGIGSSPSIDFKADDDSTVWLSIVDLMTNTNLDNSYYKNIKDYNLTKFQYIQDRLKNADFLVLWITKGWQESWFDKTKLQNLLDANKTLLFNYWYFGDSIGGSGAIDKILDQKDEYLNDAKRLGNFIADLNGTVGVVMEPEFNKQSITSSLEDSKKFAQILKDAIKEIRAKKSNVLFSICPMDTGIRNSATNYGGYKRDSLGDRNEWSKFLPIIDELKDEIDFITFQEMISQFTKDSSKFPSDELINYTKDELGLKDLPKRIENFSSFLNERYNLPVLLGYITLPEVGWIDKNSNNKIDSNELIDDMWLNESVAIYHRLKRNAKSLYNHGLFGFAPMALFDDPDHDAGGYQFFSENEYHIGIIATDAISGTAGTPRSANMRFKGLNSISILDILYSNQPYLYLDKGWNLVGLSKNEDLSKFDGVWTNIDGKWYANIKGIGSNILKNQGIEQLNKIETHRGYWVLTNRAMLTAYDLNRAEINNCIEINRWNMCSHIETKDLEKIYFNFIWKYDRGVWKQKNSSQVSYSNIDNIEELYLDEGFWIRK